MTEAISWQDRRNAVLLERLRHLADRVREITGLPLSPHYGASKLRWCLDHVSAVQHAAAAQDVALGPLSSYLVQGLVHDQSAVVDPANAARTLLFDPTALDWQPALAASQPWRWWTAAWVHLSPMHLAANLLGAALLAALGWAARCEVRDAAAWLLAWPLTHLGLLMQPELAHYGGLLGVLTCTGTPATGLPSGPVTMPLSFCDGALPPLLVNAPSRSMTLVSPPSAEILPRAFWWLAYS